MKRILVLLMCFNIALAPTYVLASAAEKWEILENVYDTSKKTVHIEAKRITQAAANSGKFVVDVPVSASTLGSTLKTMMWTGVAVAGVEALLQGIGWVIDSGSQTIWKYKPDVHKTPPSTNDYLYSYNGQTYRLSQAIDAYIQFQMIRKAGSYVGQDYKVTKYTVSNTSTRSNVSVDFSFKMCATGCSPAVNYPYSNVDRTVTYTFYGDYLANQNPPEKVYLSDSDLGNEVMGQGENTSPLTPAIATAYNPNNPASDAPAPKQSNDALENSNPQPDTDTSADSSPKPNVDTDGDGVPDAYDPAQPDAGDKITIPPACDWFPAACDFFLVQKADNKEIKQNQKDQIQQDKTFYEKASEFFDSFTFDSDLPPNESPEIADLPIPELKEDAVSWAAQCPNDVQVPINMQGVSSTITFSWSPWCQLLSIIKPAIVASAYIGAAFIVLGLRT